MHARLLSSSCARKQIQRGLPCLIILGMLLSACTTASPSQTQPAATHPSQPTARQISATTTAPPASPTAIVTTPATATSVPTTTPSPSPWPSPTPGPWDPLSLQGTPLPGSRQVIDIENLEQLKTLARWGLGRPTGVHFSTQGDWLGVETNVGNYAFDAQSFTPLQVASSAWDALQGSSIPQYTLDYSRCQGQADCYEADLLKDGEKILELSASGEFAVTIDGNLVATELFAGGMQQLWLYDMDASKPPKALDTHAEDASGLSIPCFHEISDLAFSPVGDLLAVACQGGGVYLYRTTDGSLQSSLGPAPIVQGQSPAWLRFSPDGARLASYQAGNLLVWPADATGNLPQPDISIVVPGAAVQELLAFSPDWRWLAVANVSGTVQVYDLTSGNLAHSLLDSAPQVDILAISPDGQVVANNVANPALGQAIQLRRLSDGFVLNTLTLPVPPDAYLYRALFTSDGQLLLASTSEGVFAWQLPGGEPTTAVAAGHNPEVAFQIALHPDGKTLLALNESGLRAYSLPGLKAAGELRGPANPLTFALSPSGDQVVIGTEGLFQVRSYPQGKRLLDIDLPNLQVDKLVFAPDGSQLLVTWYDLPQNRYEYQVYATDSWELAYQLPASIDLGTLQVYSPDGSLLATINGSEIVLRRASDLRGLVTLPGHADFVYNLAFTPDGSLLVSTSFDGSLRFWGLP